MKKILSFITTLFLAFSFVIPTFAAGKASVTQENFVTVDNWGTRSYAFAKVENTGNKPIEYSAGLFEIYDTNGDTLASTSYLQVHGLVLQPGEYFYLEANESIDDQHTSADVDDYMLTVTATNGSDNRTERYSCPTKWLPDFTVNRYWTKDYMEATFTNATEETVFGLSIALALLDEAGNILFVSNKDFYSDVGIPSGSSIIVREEVSSTLLDYYEAKGIKPATVDAYAYVDPK